MSSISFVVPFSEFISVRGFTFDEGGNITGFPGNYSDYRAYEDSQPKLAATKEKSTDSRIKSSSGVKLSYNENKEFQNLEKEISQLQTARIKLEDQFVKKT